ncbi:MAG: CBS domain-containing protein, partial [Nitrosopumilus sp.]|nr:CBS domain-containing protein [Nitrosopumilus sp.]NNL52999.1 CBS domain-containing protein [Nitrosopumilus sp.]
IARLAEKKFPTTKISTLSRRPFFIYSSERISHLLIELKKQDMHMAIVLNEQDQLVGIITVEDLLEEIVGDIVGEAKKQ